jgi:hypothetical protein
MGTRRRRHPRIGARATRLQPGVGQRAGPGPRSHPRIGMGTGALRHPRVGAGITRLQPGIGRRTWPWAGERAGSWVGARASASGRARIGPPAMARPPAGIIGGRAAPGPGGFLRTSVSHASPLRPAARNPSWPSSAKSLHHAASAGGAATWSAGAGASALVGAWSRPNRSRACPGLCVRERARIVRERGCPAPTVPANPGPASPDRPARRGATLTRHSPGPVCSQPGPSPDQSAIPP